MKLLPLAERGEASAGLEREREGMGVRRRAGGQHAPEEEESGGGVGGTRVAADESVPREDVGIGSGVEQLAGV